MNFNLDRTNGTRRYPVILLALGALLSFSATAKAQEHIHSNAPAFPVVLGAPQTAATLDSQSKEPIYTQTFAPRSAVRTTEDLVIPFKTSIILASGPAHTLKAGSLLIEASIDDAKVYCTSIRQKAGDLLSPQYDLGVCFKDENNTGAFTKMVEFVPAILPTRAPFETIQMLQLGLPAYEPVHVTYAAAPVDDTLQSHINIVSRWGGLAYGRRLVSTVDYAPALRDDIYADAAKELTAYMEWPGMREAETLKGAEPKNDPVTFGDGVSLSLSKTADGQTSIRWLKLPADTEATLRLGRLSQAGEAIFILMPGNPVAGAQDAGAH